MGMPEVLRGATRWQIERAARAQADIWQTHFREFRGESVE